MSETLHIRQARQDDIPVLLGLIEALYHHEQIAFDAECLAELLGTLISHPDQGEILLLIEGDQYAGYLVLTWCFSLEFSGRFGLLDELYVAPPFRGGGRAAQAIDAAIASCRGKNIQALRLEVTEGNDRAANVYRRHGFRTDPRRLMTLRL